MEREVSHASSFALSPLCICVYPCVSASVSVSLCACVSVTGSACLSLSLSVLAEAGHMRSRLIRQVQNNSRTLKSLVGKYNDRLLSVREAVAAGDALPDFIWGHLQATADAARTMETLSVQTISRGHFPWATKLPLVALLRAYDRVLRAAEECNLLLREMDQMDVFYSAQQHSLVELISRYAAALRAADQVPIWQPFSADTRSQFICECFIGFQFKA